MVFEEPGVAAVAVAAVLAWLLKLDVDAELSADGAVVVVVVAAAAAACCCVPADDC